MPRPHRQRERPDFNAFLGMARKAAAGSYTPPRALRMYSVPV